MANVIVKPGDPAEGGVAAAREATAEVPTFQPFAGKRPKPYVFSKPDSLRGSRDMPQDTAYSHNTSSNSESAQVKDIKIDFLPNILDNYDVYTYHFKFFITTLKDAADGNVMDRKSQTIIVESGVTDLTIDNVELQGIAVPSLEAGTGTQTLLKFQVLEPGGAGLLDKMFYEATALGIGNWLVMPSFLQLEFRGRDPFNSEVVTGGDPTTLAGLKWVWPIKITNCKANVSSSGTKYDFEAVFYDEMAQSNSYFAIQHTIKMQSLDTFGKAIDDLSNKLNADQYEKLVDNYSIPDVYNIVVDADLKDIKIALPNANQSTSRAGSYIDLAKKSATYNTGTGIDKIIDSLLGSSEFYQKNLQSAATSISEPKSANEAAPMRNLWRIITETKPIAYDALRQDNAVEITIYIVKYNIGLIEATPAQTGQTPDTLLAARKRLATYNETGILKKKYNYIFTGLNDQIINFDLNMNFSFAASLSRFGGIFLDTANSDPGIVKPVNTLKDEQFAAERIRKAIRFVNDPTKSAQEIEDELAAAQQVTGSAISRESMFRYATLLSYAKPADRVNFVKEVRANQGLGGAGNLDGPKIIAKSLAKSPPGSDLRFISDVDVLSPDAKLVREMAEATRRGKLRPVPYREATQESNFTGVDPSGDAGRARTSSLFSTALYSTLDASLVKITLTIKGDPFWLYPRLLGVNGILQYKSNMKNQQDAIKLIKRGHEAEHNNTVNTFGTDNFIVVRFRTPRIYNEDTGIPDAYSDVETYSGIYKVVLITSKFENGKFTQELMCLLDNLIDLKDFPDFIRQLENANSTADRELVNPQQSEDRPDRAEIPITSVRTNKLRTFDSEKGQVNTTRSNTGNVTTPTLNPVSILGKRPESNIPTNIGFRESTMLQRRFKR